MSELLRWVAIADGDHVGELLGAITIGGDEDDLVRASKAIDSDRERLAEWFEELGAAVILSVADTVIATGQGDPPRADSYPIFKPTWSVGIGLDLSGAHAALAVAKAMGRSRVIDGRRWET